MTDYTKTQLKSLENFGITISEIAVELDNPNLFTYEFNYLDLIQVSWYVVLPADLPEEKKALTALSQLVDKLAIIEDINTDLVEEALGSPITFIKNTDYLISSKFLDDVADVKELIKKYEYFLDVVNLYHAMVEHGIWDSLRNYNLYTV